MDNYLHICGSFTSGGITNFVKGIINENGKFNSNHYVGILQYSTQKDDQFYIDISECRRNLFKALKFADEAKINYQKIFVHSADYLLMFAFFLRNVECYFFQHGMGVSHGNWFKRFIKKYWFSVLPILFKTKVICSSDYAIKKSRSLGINLRDDRVYTIQFGTDISRREGITTHKKNQPIVIGTAGRLVSIKRFDKFLKSMIDYSRNRDLEIRIAGEGPEKEKLVRITKKIENSRINIRFLGEVKNMQSFYDDLDLFVFPSHNESYGLVVLESLFRNVPVALFKDIGGALHLIEDGKNGFILNEFEKGLQEIWRIIDDNPQILQKMKLFISKSNYEKYYIAETRRQLESIS